MISFQKQSSSLTGVDLFCGSGGSTLAAVRAGFTIHTAVNHWQTALDSHQLNHPQTRHLKEDLLDPLTISKLPKVRVLIGSPECTKHSIAQGITREDLNQKRMFVECNYDPSAERSRATMWGMYKYTASAKPDAVIIENVVDAYKWDQYKDWFKSMQNLKYTGYSLFFNSMFFGGTPQSRDRAYWVFIKKGIKQPDLKYYPPCYCHYCEAVVKGKQTWKNNHKVGKYPAQYIYSCPTCFRQVSPFIRPAMDVLDLSLPIQTIGDRKKPLVDKTMQRIRIGLQKWQKEQTKLQQNNASVSQNIPVWYTKMFGNYNKVHDVSSTALGSITTIDHHGLLMAPFIYKHGMSSNVQPATEQPCWTITAAGNHHAVVLVPYYESARHVIDAEKLPMGTITTGGVNHAVMLMPYYGSSTTMSNAENAAVGTITTKARYAMTIAPSEIHTPIDIDACQFRMLSPIELQRGMGFEDSYKITGNQTDKIKQLGNSVTPPVMQWICERVRDVLEPDSTLPVTV